MAGVGPSPISLEGIKTFDKKALKKTETTVTNTDGSRVIEGKDGDGRTYTKTTESSYGFVLDHALDLQVAEVSDGLVMGSQDVAHDYDVLEKHGVTHILNVATGVENKYPDKIKYQTQEWRDLPDFQIFHGFDRAIKFIEDSISSGGRVFVHCNAGISRAASVCIAYLIKTKGMTVDESLSHLRATRPGVCPNPGFHAQLEHFYEKLHEKN